VRNRALAKILSEIGRSHTLAGRRRYDAAVKCRKLSIGNLETGSIDVGNIVPDGIDVGLRSIDAGQIR
jgi:hypothetical protein